MTGAVAVADVDDDGHQDLVATTNGETTISYGDGDGHPDFVIAQVDWTTNSLFVILHQ
ncbi:MAG: hypothetical protein IT385_03900 [Deltaproteobacteria bacterium]|nr:hypothetical protein [Deltaproteobacteria bacterium]